MLTIKNNAKRMQVFNLPHDVACSESACGCTRQLVGVTDLDPKTGDKTVRALKRRLADSITLTAAGSEGDTLEGLPNGVAFVPEIKAAAARKEITIKRVDDDAPVVAGAKPAAPKPSAPAPAAPVAEKTSEAAAPAAPVKG